MRAALPPAKSAQVAVLAFNCFRKSHRAAQTVGQVRDFHDLRSGVAVAHRDKRRLSEGVWLAVGSHSVWGLAPQSRVAVIGDIIVKGNRAARRNFVIAWAGKCLNECAGDGYIDAGAIPEVYIDLTAGAELAMALVLIEQRFLLDIRQQGNLPGSRATGIRADGKRAAKSVRVLRHAQTKLLQIVRTLRAACGLARHLHGGKKQRYQHADDGNYHQ